MHKLSRLSSTDIGDLVELVNHNRLSEAEHRIRVLLAAHPDSGMLWKVLSVALLRQGKDALQPLLRATELMPLDAEAHRNLGTALHDRGQWAAALLSLQTALALHPDDPGALVDAANASRAIGRTREAVPLYQKALQLNPGEIEAHNNLGNAFLELDQNHEAIACYRRALELKADDAQIQTNLSNALWRAGLLDQAINASQRAISLDPGQSVAHNNHGLILASLGQREQAAASYTRALELRPEYAEALNNFGNLLLDLGRGREAFSLHAKAVKLEPQSAESHCNLANTLIVLRRVDEAMTSYRQALTLKANFAPALFGLALALRQQRRPEEAVASCRAALASDPANVDALSLLGELLADNGRFSEAQQLFQRSIAINPDFGFAYSSIASHRRMTDNDKDWLSGVKTLLTKRLPLAQEISLRYALGKYSDDIGQYDQAFDHYRQANELSKRYGVPYNGADLTLRVDRIVRRFDAQFTQACQESGSDAQLPIFVIGMPRSGTSLTEQILASHPAVLGAGELTYWLTAYGAFEQADSGRGSALELVPTIARDCLERLNALAQGAERVIDKTPANFLYAGLIHAVFPKARIIHMQRHPLDTCLSIYFQNFFNVGPHANDLSDLAHYYREYLRVMAHWRTVLPATILLEVPYEALIGAPETWTRRMLEFIGLPWDPRCLDFDQTDRTTITASKWQVRQRINKGSVGRWRNYEHHIGPLRSLCS